MEKKINIEYLIRDKWNKYLLNYDFILDINDLKLNAYIKYIDFNLLTINISIIVKIDKTNKKLFIKNVDSSLIKPQNNIYELITPQILSINFNNYYIFQHIYINIPNNNCLNKQRIFVNLLKQFTDNKKILKKLNF